MIINSHQVYPFPPGVPGVPIPTKRIHSHQVYSSSLGVYIPSMSINTQPSVSIPTRCSHSNQMYQFPASVSVPTKCIHFH